MEAKKKTAVIIKGNPEYVEGKDKKRADRFYKKTQKFLKREGYESKLDPGAPFTVPEDADLWIGHSRGSDRLRFAPKGTKTIAVGAPSKGAINHRKDKPAVGKKPVKAHYKLSKAMKAKMREKMASDRKPHALQRIEQGRAGKLSLEQAKKLHDRMKSLANTMSKASNKLPDVIAMRVKGVKGLHIFENRAKKGEKPAYSYNTVLRDGMIPKKGTTYVPQSALPTQGRSKVIGKERVI